MEGEALRVALSRGNVPEAIGPGNRPGSGSIKLKGGIKEVLTVASLRINVKNFLREELLNLGYQITI